MDTLLKLYTEKEKNIVVEDKEKRLIRKLAKIRTEQKEGIVVKQAS